MEPGGGREDRRASFVSGPAFRFGPRRPLRWPTEECPPRLGRDVAARKPLRASSVWIAKLGNAAGLADLVHDAGDLGLHDFGSVAADLVGHGAGVSRQVLHLNAHVQPSFDAASISQQAGNASLLPVD